MFSWKKMWDRWLSSGEIEETPGRGNDYVDRIEPAVDVELPALPSDEDQPSPPAARETVGCEALHGRELRGGPIPGEENR